MNDRPKILLIEDEPAIADTVTYALKTEGFEPIWQRSGAEALAALRENSPVLVILDIGLPDCNGFDLFKQIRTKFLVPVIFLTARGEEIDRVVGLEMGAEDYMVKPFSPRELTARVRVVLRRRASDEQACKQESDTGRFRHDHKCLQIYYCGTELELSHHEYRLLCALLERPGQVLSRGQLLARAWDAPSHRTERTVDAHIKTLRAKLRTVDASIDPIKTHRGFGYSLQP